MDKLIATYVHNPFDPLKSSETKELVGTYSVQECIDEFKLGLAPGYDFVVAINGEPLPEETILSEYYLDHGSIAICAIPQDGGGGKNPLRTVLMIVVVVVALIITRNPMVIEFLGPYGAVAAGVTFSAVGNMLINALLPYQSDLTGASANDFSNSSTYGWDSVGNSTKEGGAWPVIYGRPRITPPIIGKYIDVAEDKQYLNLLFAIADHSLSTLDPLTIQMNGNTVSTSDELIIETRLGSNDQPITQAFGDTRSIKSVGSKIGNTWTTVKTAGNAVEGIGIAISFPKGLWYANDDGSLAQTSVELDMEYAPSAATTGNWINIQTKNSVSTVATASQWVAGSLNGWQWVQYEAGSTSATAHQEDDPYYGDGTEWITVYDEYGWATFAKRAIGSWKWIEAGLVMRVIGSITLDHIQIAGSQSSPMRKIFYKDHVTSATSYDVRMKFHSAPATTSRYGNDVYYEYVEEIIYDDFSYPGSSLLAIRALATDKISGGLPTITIIANRVSVPIWDSTLSTWCEYLSNNPAWASWDMLYNSSYGGGINKDRINFVDFATWATYCSANNLVCNIYIDQTISFRKALDTIGQLGRGRVVQLGSTFTCFVDKAETLPVQGFMFNVANMEKNSFAEEFMAMDDRANVVEITYWDETLDYQSQTVEIYADDFDTTTREVKSTSINLIGCTNRAMAIKHGKYLLNCNRYQTITASWNADIDSLACMPWDVVEVQHDVPQWGYGGRVVSSTLSTIVLDQQITMATSGSYVIRIKSSNTDVVQQKTIDAVLVETTTSTISPIATFDSIPATFDMFTIYENTTQTKWFRILNLQRKDDLTRKVIAIEYNANIYSDSTTSATAEVYTSLHMVDHLKATEIWKGEADTRVQLTWTGFAMAWHVWHRRTASNEIWTDDGIVRQPFIEINGLAYGMEYEFCVSHTNNNVDGETVKLTPVADETVFCGTILDVLYRVVATVDSGVTGNVSELYNGDLDSGGIVVP